ncbi:lipopolysaccharide biosynthesis protein [Methanolobus sp. WCC4]|uniref:lipopolysaccharide biosynthesis protein n=1 Tax=Methanolobus sp. WCC4 TaxID=3125784 RepID=UPI0030FAD230
MSLKQLTITNLKISAGMSVFSKVLGMLTSVVLARLLLPSDFGIITIVYIFLGAMNLFTELGFGSAVIHRKEKIEEALGTSFTINLIISVFLFFIIFFAAPYLASFYDEPVITNVLRVLGIGIIFSAFQFVPSVYFRKNLQFGKTAIPAFVSGLTNTIVAIILAYSGFGVWSLVYGSLASTFVNVVMLLIMCPCKPKLTFDMDIGKELFVFGKYLFAANIIIFINLHIDDAIGGKLLGITALGYYYLAYRWGTFAERIIGITEKVMFPTYAKIQDDLPKMRKGYLGVLKYVSIMTFPISIGLFAIAPEFVTVVLGEKWVPSIIPMQILCFFGLFSTIASTTGSVFTAAGKPKFVRDISSLMTVLIIVLIYPMSIYYGIIGLSLTVTIGAILSAIIASYYLLKVLDLDFLQYISAIKYSIVASSIALIATVAIKYALKNWYYVSNINSLIVLFSTFSIVYMAVLYLTDKKTVFDLVRMTRLGFR